MYLFEASYEIKSFHSGREAENEECKEMRWVKIVWYAEDMIHICHNLQSTLVEEVVLRGSIRGWREREGPLVRRLSTCTWTKWLWWYSWWYWVVSVVHSGGIKVMSAVVVSVLSSDFGHWDSPLNVSLNGFKLCWLQDGWRIRVTPVGECLVR